MRKVVLFLLLFGVGFLALVLIDRARRGEPAGPAPAETAASEGPGAEEPAEPQRPPAPDRTDVRLEGVLQVTTFAPSGTKLYRLDAKDVQPGADGDYDATDLEIDVFDETTGEPRVSMTAARGELRIDNEDSRRIRLADEGRVDLTDVDVVQHTGGPVAPLDLKAPKLTGFVERQRFETPDDTEVELEGQGLTAKGRGLDFDGLAGSVAFNNGGRVTLERKDMGSVWFTTGTGGRISIDRLDEEGRLRLLAAGGVELVLENDGESRITGERMELSARVVDGLTVLESASLAGNVVALRGDDRFRGDRATMSFSGDASLRQVQLEGSPTWSVVLEGAGREPLAIEGDGDGPMTVEWDDATTFEMEGTSSLRAAQRDLSIESNGGMRGALDAGGDRGTFIASDEVVLRHGSWRVETGEVETAVRGSSEEAQVFGRGVTRFVGDDPRTGPLELTANDGVDLAGAGETWKVVEAREIELVTQGENAFVASAGRIVDLDWDENRFEALEGVAYSSALGKGSSDRAVVLGPKSFDLFGTDERPARFEMAPLAVSGDEPPVSAGSFEGRRIEVSANEIVATERVRGRLLATDREYRLDCSQLRVESEPAPEGERRPFRAQAEGVSRASLSQDAFEVVLSSESLSVEGEWRGPEGAPLEASRAEALGQVELEYVGEFEVGAAGDRFVANSEGLLRIEADEGQRVSAWGQFPTMALPYEMNADWVEFGAERLRAPGTRIFVDAELLPLADPLTGDTSFTQAVADWLVADRDGVLLNGSVRMDGVDQRGRGLHVEADNLRLLAKIDPDDAESTDPREAVERFEAWGGFRATYEGNAQIEAEYCRASPDRLLLEGEPAQLEVLGMALESSQIDIDLDNFLISSRRGVFRGAEDRGAWSIEFASVTPIVDGDEMMIVLLAPVYQTPTSGARADWSIMWVDSQAWRARGREQVWGEPSPERTKPVAPPMPERDLVPNIFRRLHAGDLSDFMRALYLEGEAEVTENGAREARADAIFLDVDKNSAWMKNAEIVPVLELGDRVERVRTRANEIHTASDGTLRAERATLSACNHEVPHYLIETGELVLEPREGGSWRVSARKNRLLFAGGFQVPLPPIGRAVLDQSGDLLGFENESGELITFDHLVFGRTARFGTAVATAFQRDIGFAGKAFSRLFGFNFDRVRGKWNYEAAWLSSRGPLGRVGLELRERKRRENRDEEFWLDLYASAIPDDGEDRGLQRADPNEVESVRQWYNARGRYPISTEQWIDIAFTKQSDEGVQAEFYENDFLRYENRDTFVHWRLADDAVYYDATANIRVEDFRTELERAAFGRGSTAARRPSRKSATFRSSTKLRWTSTTCGVAKAISRCPRSSAMASTRSSRTDSANAKCCVWTPRTRSRLRCSSVAGSRRHRSSTRSSRRGTAASTKATIPRASDCSPEPNSAPRFGRATTTGFLHALAPVARFRGELTMDESGGAPVQFDARDRPLDGKQFEAGVRSRWWKPGSRRSFDLELRGIRRYDRPDGLTDFNEVGLLGGIRRELGSTLFSLLYDLRVDAEDGSTNYSRTTFGIRPGDDFALEFSHDRGADDDNRPSLRSGHDRGTLSVLAEVGVRGAPDRLDRRGLQPQQPDHGPAASRTTSC